MTDLRYIQDLLSTLKQHGVKTFKDGSLNLEFHAEHLSSSESPPITSSESSTKIISDTIKQQEQALPPDLRADTLMDHDKVLNWSSPDQAPDEKELPLTGEQPL